MSNNLKLQPHCGNYNSILVSCNKKISHVIILWWWYADPLDKDIKNILKIIIKK